jgi:hypothetical protein
MAIRIVGMAVCVATWAFVAGGGAAGVQAQALIYACVKPSQGQLRIVEAAEVCPAGERRLEWPAGAPSTGALRVVDAGGKFIGRYGYGGTTVIAVGAEWIAVSLTADGPRKHDTGPLFYFNTACPNPADKTALHGTAGYLGVYSRELVKFALGFPEAPNVVYYPGAEDPAFVPLSYEFTEGTLTGQQRVCYTFDQPPLFQKYAPAQTFDLGVFTTPYRVVQ